MFSVLSFSKNIEKTQIIQYNVNCKTTQKKEISMFEEIVTKNGVKFNDLEKKI